MMNNSRALVASGCRLVLYELHLKYAVKPSGDRSEVDHVMPHMSNVSVPGKGRFYIVQPKSGNNKSSTAGWNAPGCDEFDTVKLRKI